MRGVGIKGRFRIIAHREAGMGLLSGSELRRALKAGAAKLVFERHNLVVNQGLQALAAILGNGAGAPTIGSTVISSAADLAITTMQMGNSVSPPTPGSTDTNGVLALVVAATPTVTYTFTSPSLPEVNFGIVLTTADYPTVVFTEEALICANGLVFAKVAPFSYGMATHTGYQFDHTLTMSRV